MADPTSNDNSKERGDDPSWPAYQVAPPERAHEDQNIEAELKKAGLENVAHTTKLASIVNWARKFSLFQYPFVTACCGMEFMSVTGSHYDTARFGAEVPRFSPRQADLLFVVGTVTHKQAPILRMVYEQMAEPKWVIAFGVCASTGGFYDNYATVPGIDHIVPVDVYIPGCPPRPEQVMDGIMYLQDKIQKEPLRIR
jgi:NADH-quinone oxidoreductase subunit B